MKIMYDNLFDIMSMIDGKFFIDTEHKTEEKIQDFKMRILLTLITEVSMLSKFEKLLSIVNKLEEERKENTYKMIFDCLMSYVKELNY